MRQRAVSAVIFVVAMLGGLFGGAVSFYILFAIITGGSLWELMGMFFRNDREYGVLRRCAGLVLGCLPFLAAGLYFLGGVHHLTLLAGAVLLPVFVLFLVELFLQSEAPFTQLGHYLLGLAYVGIPMALLVSVAYWFGGYAPWRVLGLLLLTWTNDTMAYVTGSMIGKRPFFSRISPKKTWEGTLGGVFFTFAVAYALSLFFSAFSLPQWLVLAACVAVFGTLGDLVESMLKRSMQVKDSGSILPGHGGFLDRFDSFIFVLPFAWTALALLEALLQ